MIQESVRCESSSIVKAWRDYAALSILLRDSNEPARKSLHVVGSCGTKERRFSWKWTTK